MKLTDGERFNRAVFSDKVSDSPILKRASSTTKNNSDSASDSSDEEEIDIVQIREAKGKARESPPPTEVAPDSTVVDVHNTACSKMRVNKI